MTKEQAGAFSKYFVVGCVSFSLGLLFMLYTVVLPEEKTAKAAVSAARQQVRETIIEVRAQQKVVDALANRLLPPAPIPTAIIPVRVEKAE